MTEMSEAAQSVLINMSSSRQGTTPKGRNPTDTIEELQAVGVLGQDYGLTRHGGIVRDRLVSARLDAAFL